MLQFSIVIPVYNRADSLLSALRSVKKQTCKSYEVIIVDDASTDNSSTLAKDHLKSLDLPGQFVQMDKNSGCNISRNTGVSVSKGEWLVFLDSDDQFLTEDSLEEIYKTIQSNQETALFMFACEGTNGLPTSSNPDFDGHLTYVEYLKRKVNGEYLPVAKSSNFQVVRYREDIRGGEGLTWLKMAKLFNGVYFSSYKARLYENQAGNRLSNKSRSYYARISKIFWVDLKSNTKDYLTDHPLGIVMRLLKCFYYRVRSIV